MRIVITGTNGFIGKNLLNELKNQHDILEINEDIFDLDKYIPPMNRNDSLQYVVSAGLALPF